MSSKSFDSVCDWNLCVGFCLIFIVLTGYGFDLTLACSCAPAPLPPYSSFVYLCCYWHNANQLLFETIINLVLFRCFTVDSKFMHSFAGVTCEFTVSTGDNHKSTSIFDAKTLEESAILVTMTGICMQQLIKQRLFMPTKVCHETITCRQLAIFYGSVIIFFFRKKISWTRKSL